MIADTHTATLQDWAKLMTVDNKTRVLIVDDDPDIRRTLSTIVGLWGGEAMCAEDAGTALRMSQEGAYEFILLDFKMPDHSGQWFMEQAQLPAATKVVLISGYVPQPALQAMKDLGISDYMEKPFEVQALLDVLDRHVAQPND